jgi:hypothetical protein
MHCFRLCCLVLLAASPLAAQEKYTIQVGDNPPPKELAESIQKVLRLQSVQLLDPSGKSIGEFWFRAELPTDANATQIKNGLTYKEIAQTEILGAVKLEAEYRDYRKQKVKAGVYTLRLGYQPADGDHQGSSDFQDFVVAVAAEKDKNAGPMEPKEMIEASMKSIGTGHPAVFMLFPGIATKAMPELSAQAKKHWVLYGRSELTAGGQKTGSHLGIGITVIGSAE